MDLHCSTYIPVDEGRGLKCRSSPNRGAAAGNRKGKGKGGKGNGGRGGRGRGLKRGGRGKSARLPTSRYVDEIELAGARLLYINR